MWGEGVNGTNGTEGAVGPLTLGVGGADQHGESSKIDEKAPHEETNAIVALLTFS